MTELLYDRLRDRITIDPARLDQESMDHPMLMEQVCEGVADAIFDRDKLINNLDYAKARLRRDLRDRPSDDKKRMTNDDIEFAIVIDDRIGKLIESIEYAKRAVARWNGLLEAYRAKGSALKRLGELMHAGYAASSSVLRSPRERIRDASDDLPRRARRDV